MVCLEKKAIEIIMAHAIFLTYFSKEILIGHPCMIDPVEPPPHRKKLAKKSSRWKIP